MTTTFEEAKPGEGSAGTEEPAAAETAGGSRALLTGEAAALLGIRPSALYTLSHHRQELFPLVKDERGRLLWTAADVETARALLRRRAEPPEPDGKLSTAEVCARLGISTYFLNKLRSALGDSITLETRGRGRGLGFRWPPEAVPLLAEALAVQRAAVLERLTGATTAEVAAELGLNVERVLDLRRRYQIPAVKAWHTLRWSPEAIQRLRAAAAAASEQRSRQGPREGLSTREVAALAGVSAARVGSLLVRFAGVLAVSKEGGKYSWSEENVARLRSLLARLASRPERVSTHHVAALLGVPYLRLLSLSRPLREKLSLVRHANFLEWNPEAIAQMREVVARWRASARDVQPLPQPAVIRSLPGGDLLLVEPQRVLLFSSRKLGVTARLAGLDLEAQGAHPREAVARLRRLLPLRYQELAAQPLQEPGLWASLQEIIVPRTARRAQKADSAEPPEPAAGPAAAPPVIDPESCERFEGFRETTLAVITDPGANATLRAMGGLVYSMSLGSCPDWPRGPEGSFRHRGRAAVADLRHLQGYLTWMGREAEASALTKDEQHISRRCATLARRVRDIANAFEAELDAVREQTPPPAGE